MRRRDGDRGAAAVEFALVLPVLLLFVFGIIDFGRMLSAKITLVHAATEGARATALAGEAAGLDRIATAAESLDEAGGELDADVVDCGPGATIEDDATVTLTYRFAFITPLAIFAGLDTDGDGAELTARSEMPCLR